MDDQRDIDAGGGEGEGCRIGPGEEELSGAVAPPMPRGGQHRRGAIDADAAEP